MCFDAYVNKCGTQKDHQQASSHIHTHESSATRNTSVLHASMHHTIRYITIPNKTGNAQDMETAEARQAARTTAIYATLPRSQPTQEPPHTPANNNPMPAGNGSATPSTNSATPSTNSATPSTSIPTTSTSGHLYSNNSVPMAPRATGGVSVGDLTPRTRVGGQKIGLLLHQVSANAAVVVEELMDGESLAFGVFSCAFWCIFCCFLVRFLRAFWCVFLCFLMCLWSVMHFRLCMCGAHQR
jgi:hypothetical protein